MRRGHRLRRGTRREGAHDVLTNRGLKCRGEAPPTRAHRRGEERTLERRACGGGDEAVLLLLEEGAYERLTAWDVQRQLCREGSTCQIETTIDEGGR